MVNDGIVGHLKQPGLERSLVFQLTALLECFNQNVLQQIVNIRRIAQLGMQKRFERRTILLPDLFQCHVHSPHPFWPQTWEVKHTLSRQEPANAYICRLFPF